MEECQPQGRSDKAWARRSRRTCSCPEAGPPAGPVGPLPLASQLHDHVSKKTLFPVLRTQSFVSSAKPTVQLGDADSFPWEQAGRSFQALFSKLFRSEHDSGTDFSGSWCKKMLYVVMKSNTHIDNKIRAFVYLFINTSFPERCLPPSFSPKAGISQVCFTVESPRSGRRCLGAGGLQSTRIRSWSHTMSRSHPLVFARHLLSPPHTVLFASGSLCTAHTWEHLHKLLGILVHGFVYSPPFVYSIVCLYQCGLVGICFMLWIMIQHDFILLFKLSQLWPLGAPSVGSWVPLTCSLFTFWHDKKLQTHPVQFLLQSVLESVISPRSPGGFLWRMEFRHQGLGTGWVFWLVRCHCLSVVLADREETGECVVTVRAH